MDQALDVKMISLKNEFFAKLSLQSKLSVYKGLLRLCCIVFLRKLPAPDRPHIAEFNIQNEAHHPGERSILTSISLIFFFSLKVSF